MDIAKVWMSFPVWRWVALVLLLGSSQLLMATGVKLVVQTGQGNSVTEVAVSPDGRWAASASSGAVKLWEAGTTREVRTILSDGLATGAVAFSPDGKRLATGGTDRDVKVWDVLTGAQVRSFPGHTDRVTSVDISPDGRWLASASDDTQVKIWDMESGALVRTFTGHTGAVRAVRISPDGRHLASGGADKTLRLWELAGGRTLHTLAGHTAGVSALAFSPDGRRLASGSADKTVRLWDLGTGREVHVLTGHRRAVHAVAFSPDGRWLASGGDSVTLWDPVTGQSKRRLKSRDRTGVALALAFSPTGEWLVAGYWASMVKLWNLSDGREQATLGEFADSVMDLATNPDGKWLAAGTGDTTVKMWNAATGQQERLLRGHRGLIRSIAFSPDGRFLASGGDDKQWILWDATTGRKVRAVDGLDDAVSQVAFSPDGNWLATGSGHHVVSARGDNTVAIWDVATGRKLRGLAGHRRYVRALAFSPDGSFVVSGSDDKTVKVWDPVKGRELRSLSGHKGRVVGVAVSPDSRLIASGSKDGTVRVWEAATGRDLQTLNADTRDRRRGGPPVAFGPDGRLLASGGDGRDIKLWDLISGELEQVLRGHTGPVSALAFLDNGRKVVSGSLDGTSRVWDVSTGAELIRLVSFRNDTWAAVDPFGRFDASNGGDVEGLHWVVGEETIALSQLKERYYAPGLLAKVLGLNKEPLRAVSGFSDVALYPEIEVHKPTDTDPNLGIHLTNRGGGIGKVVVLINGKEVTADARGPNPDPNAGELQLAVHLAGHPYLLPGQDNAIEVRALNAEGYLSSRGRRVGYRPPEEMPLERPTLWAIVAGVSDYTGEDIDLRYAAKDAQAMATALQLGAKRLFGAENLRLTLLDYGPSHAVPSKANIRAAFEKARAAKPQDILVLYLAGHGVGLGDTYYYLTQEARSTDLTDPAIRARVALSSEELVEWIKETPALKQVMILDTCAAGTATKKLVESRNVSADQIRAIERLKDRTGFHVLMGSAADAVSYEATRYEQGLLTYALLQGLRGAALRENQYVDVSRLFQHAADVVPDLASHIGGIQRPLIAAPRGTSFDIGQLTTTERQAIPLAASKPLVLSPVAFNSEQGYDDLGLTGRLRSSLREKNYASLRGDPSRFPAVYVDAEQMAGAIRPNVSYRVKQGTINARVVFTKDGEKLAERTISGSAANVEGVTSSIVDQITQAVAGM